MENAALAPASAPEDILPPKEIFGTLNLKNPGGMANLADRFALKEMVEALHAQSGLPMNDVLNFYGISVVAYYNVVDPMKAPNDDVFKKRISLRPNKHRAIVLRDRTHEQQIALFHQVEKLHLIEGHSLPVACDLANISLSQYWKIRRLSEEQDARMRNGGVAQEPVAQNNGLLEDAGSSAPVPIDENMRPVFFDAAILLSVAMQQTVSAAAALLGTTFGDLARWRKELHLERLFDGTRNGLPLPPDRLRLRPPERIRTLKALTLLEQKAVATRVEVAQALGYGPTNFSRWEKVMQAVATTAAAKNGNPALSFEEFTALRDLSGAQPHDLQHWLHSYGLEYANGTLPPDTENEIHDITSAELPAKEKSKDALPKITGLEEYSEELQRRAYRWLLYVLRKAQKEKLMENMDTNGVFISFLQEKNIQLPDGVHMTSLRRVCKAILNSRKGKKYLGLDE